MKKMFMGWLGILCLLVSCSEKKGPDYVAFQEEEDGKWGMISLDGEVLFSEEFKYRPTGAYNGCFLVKNKKDEWEFYTAEEKPKQFGSSYKQAGVFLEDVAPVVEKNQPISFIDKDGKTAFVLDKVDGKTVTECTNFSEGLANFKAGGYWGYINTDGEMVIPAQYMERVSFSDGVAIVVDKKYEKTEKEKRQADVIDTKGNVLFSIKASDYKEIGDAYQDGTLFVKIGDKDDEEYKGALIDKKGNMVFEANKKLQKFGFKQGDLFTFSDGDAWGIMNMDGEVIVRPKYDFVTWASDDSFYGWEEDDDDEWNETCCLYNLEGEKIGKGEYKNAAAFYNGHDFTYVNEDGEWILINKNGEDQKLKVDIHALNDGFGDWILESDFVDFEAVISDANINANGISDLSMELTPRELVKITDEVVIEADRHDSTAHGKLGVEPEAEGYRYTNEKSVDRVADIVEYTVSVSYDDYFAEPIKGKETYTDWWGYSYEREVTVGYRMRDIKPSCIKATFTNYNKLEGKLDQLYKAAIAKFKKMGKEAKSGENGKVFDVNDNRYILVKNNDYNLEIIVGNSNLLEKDLD